MAVVTAIPLNPATHGAVGAWRTWDRRQWNLALFNHYFLVKAGDAGPVSRLVIGISELAQLVGDDSVPEEVQAAFENVMRSGCSARILNDRLSLRARNAWWGEGIPPYVVDLLFTCYAAGLVDEETVEVGDFRIRLQILLKHPHGQSYQLHGLSALWEHFAEWLADRRSVGAPYRALELPDYGHENLIGYSKRLVFPQRRDRRLLVDVMSEATVGREPPLIDVLALLSSESRRFTAPFQGAIDKALIAFHNSNADQNLEILWSAVREAAALAEERRPTTAKRYQLFAMLDEEFSGNVFLMTNVEPEAVPRGLEVSRSDVPIAEFAFLVKQKNSSSDDVAGAVRLLLLGVLNTVVPGLERSFPGKLVAQGVLLFKLGVDGIYELVAYRPDDERVWGLVSESWVNGFLDLFPRTDRPEVRASRFDGWQEIGPFEGAHLSNIDQMSNSPLARLRCLQPTRTGVVLYLADGVRITGGYLSLSGALPSVRVHGVDQVRAYSVSADSSDFSREPIATLVVSREDETIFRFPHECGNDWNGRYNLVALNGDKVVATREVVFRSRALGLPLLEPSDPSRYWLEGASVDVVSVTDLSSQSPWRVSTVEGASFTSTRNDSHAQSLRRDIPEEVAVPPWVDSSLDTDTDVPGQLDRFLEWTASLAAVRKGFTEIELLDLFKRCFDHSDPSARWDVLRAWAEIGCFDVLIRRDWRGRKWFARNPALVVVRTTPGVVVCMVGLAGLAMRRRVDTAVLEHGGRSMNSRTFDPRVPTIPRWSMPNLDAVQSVARALHLPDPRFLEDPASFSAGVTKVRGAAVGEIPLSGILRSTWDWARSRFSEHRPSTDTSITLERWVRKDGPDYFVVRSAVGPVWWTPSRNWALLVAHFENRVSSYTMSDGHLILRLSSGGPHLPLPIARSVALSSGVSPGPYKRQDDFATYAYAFGSTQQRGEVIALLWGTERETAPVALRIRWLLAAVAESRVMTSDIRNSAWVTLPVAIRTALSRMTDVPGAIALASATVPSHLIPHIRHILERDAKGHI